MKIMARSKLKTNTGSGTPGSHDFKCKLPKNITLSGINTALYHIQKNHLDQAVLKDDYIEYVVNELCSIYPNLSTNICRHYCITSIENSGKFQTDVQICSDVINSDSKDSADFISFQDGADDHLDTYSESTHLNDNKTLDNEASSNNKVTSSLPETGNTRPISDDIPRQLEQRVRSPIDNDVLCQPNHGPNVMNVHDPVDNDVPHQLEKRVRDLESSVNDLRLQLQSLRGSFTSSGDNEPKTGLSKHVNNESMKHHERAAEPLKSQLDDYRRQQSQRCNESEPTTRLCQVIGDSMLKSIVPQRLSRTRRPEFTKEV